MNLSINFREKFKAKKAKFQAEKLNFKAVR